VQQNSNYLKDTRQQLLSLTGSSQNFVLNRNFFVASLSLPDRSELLGLTVFGEDTDPQGEVRLRLKRCDHSQARCTTLAETTSTNGFSAGRFETSRVAVLNESVNNGFYSYFLELQLTALSNSGLRSVRLEMLTPNGESTPGAEEQWSLANDTETFTLPNVDLTQVRICTDDLGHLDNVTHYPFVVVDGRSISLSSNSCITVWGRDIEIRRRANTGPSSGTYRFLR
jgi:hypothetical protein